MTRYLLDANVFIQAKNQHYGFDFCPAFWEWLVKENQSGKVASIDKVADELQAGNDALADWAGARGDGFFLKPDSEVVSALSTVADWAHNQEYETAAVAIFLDGADHRLVAHARAHGWTVVTHEVPADSVGKIKIPNACTGLGLRCASPYEMLRRERARFVLGPGGGGA